MITTLRLSSSFENPLLRVWVSLCIAFPAVAMLSIAAANILLALTVFGFLFLNHQSPFPKHRIFWMILSGYLGWSILTTAISPYGSLWKSWFEEFSTLLAIIPGIVVGTAFDRVKRSYRIVSIVLLLVAAYAVWQYFFGWDVLRGWKPLRYQFHRYHAIGMQDFHLTYAGVVAVTLPLAAVVWSSGLGSVTALGGIAAVMATMARSMMGAIGAGAVLLGTFGKTKLRIVALVIIAALFILPQTLFKEAGERFTRGVAITSQKQGEGDPTRKYLWLTSLAIIKDHPIAGVGSNRWDEAFLQYRIPFAGYSSTAHPHNDLLSTAVEYGIPGAILFALLWITLLILLLKPPKSRTEQFRVVRIAGATSLVTILIGGIVQCYLTDAEVSLQVWFITGAMLSMLSSPESWGETR